MWSNTSGVRILSSEANIRELNLISGGLFFSDRVVHWSHVLVLDLIHKMKVFKSSEFIDDSPLIANESFPNQAKFFTKSELSGIQSLKALFSVL